MDHGKLVCEGEM